jgi:hypothetical protein
MNTSQIPVSFASSQQDSLKHSIAGQSMDPTLQSFRQAVP